MVALSKMRPSLISTHAVYDVPLHEPFDFSQDAPVFVGIKVARLRRRALAFMGEDRMEIEDKLGSLDAHWDSQYHVIDDRFVRIWKSVAYVYEIWDVPEGYEEQAAEAFASILQRNPHDALYILPRETLDTTTWCRLYRCGLLARHYLRQMNEEGYTLSWAVL